ncbi:glucan 1,3-beta-glucosidase [Echria macrotheca]|uniref:Glucan 1,3-beta-glucosidase n=1 Tax=Echria macrotheca TaxID=438768 RepID=A0AAJ0BEQ6_9PEZI|nr:glucan 1,3-beta-glucosidase [Echria macrotheca]
MRCPYSLAGVALLATGTLARLHPILPVREPQNHQSCSGPTAGAPAKWWRAEIDHNGTTPYSTDSSFQYYRNVLRYGADNTGTKDSSGAFNDAINAWSRAGNTVTTRPAYVYIPPGTYLIKQSVQMLVNTFLIGDAANLPVLIADPALDDNPVVYGYDDLQGNNGATKNFYMAVRNLRIDTSRISSNVQAKAMEWSVSQSCSLSNIHVVMPEGSRHTGIAMNRGGSPLIISDCTFTGGAVGVEVGSQQYLLKGLSFDSCAVGIYMKWTFVVTVLGAKFSNCRYGIDAGRENSVGTMSVVDSTVSKCEAGVLAYVSGTGQNSLVLDNFDVKDAVAVKSAVTNTYLLGGSIAPRQTWVLGNTSPFNYQHGAVYPIKRPAGLLLEDKYFTAPLPQYENYDISQVVNIKGDAEFPVFGDNSHDDGPAINAILRKYADCKIVFFPQGIYRTQETINVPPGSRLVGEVFSTISGFGPLFGDADKPQPIVRIGNAGDKGVAQLSDMLVSVGDVLPGAVLVEINMAGNKPGDVGLWNVVLRVGGSNDTLVNTKCNGNDMAACKAAFALLHVTVNASAYLEDVWGWVADHGLDPHLNPDTTPQNIAVGRGALIESTAATWLVGTAFEHCVLYQYSLHKAANIFIALQQTESPYWQGIGTPLRAPAPWTPEPAYADPDFGHCSAEDDQCRRAWAQYSVDSRNVVIHGSAMWTFFNRMMTGEGPDGACLSSEGVCQTNMIDIEGAKSTFWYSISTNAAGSMVYDMTGGGLNVTLQRDNKGSWGGALAAYLRDTEDGDELGIGKDGPGNGCDCLKGGGDGQDGDGKNKPNGVARTILSEWGWVTAFLVMILVS